MTEPRKPRAPLRIPPISAFIVGILVGWFVGRWMGAILGGVVGFVLWRSRA